jgi:hypothetical protein
VNIQLQRILVFIFVFSVFSLTLQASVINFCKETKVFKNQSQQNPVTEEEEESHDGDESVDEEVFYMDHFRFNIVPEKFSTLYWPGIALNFPSSTIKILIPPPKF